MNNNIQIEQIILGQCINSRENLLTLINNGINTDDFYLIEHQKIYEGMLITFSKYNTIDSVLLTKELKDKTLSNHISNLNKSSLQIRIVNIKPHIEVLLEDSAYRKYNELFKNIHHFDCKYLGTIIKNEVEKIEQPLLTMNTKNNVKTLDKIEIKDIYSTEKIESGLIELDNKILGFAVGSLDVITGYSGNGKSTMINQICIAESMRQGKKTFVYSPELTDYNFKDWLYRTIANKEDFIETNLNGKKYKRLSDKSVILIDNWIKDKLYLYDDSCITATESKLLMTMEGLAKNKDVKVFVIDNLMKINLDGGYNNEYLAQKIFVNKLKEFARKYNVVVHLVAHLKKPQEVRKKISKFDISGTTDITNIADYVISVSRIEDELRRKNPILKDCVLKVMKDRPTGNLEVQVNLSFDKERRRFYSNAIELEKDYVYSEIEDENIITF